MAVLSNKEIKELLQSKVIIHPYQEKNLQTSSYDVTLGEFYYEEESKVGILNPYSRDSSQRVWGSVKEAQPIKNHKIDCDLGSLSVEDRIIILQPRQTILGHTNEFIGGKENITTMMKAKSSMGRSFIEVCKCAGWGDVGYFNRWTMEITNNSTHHAVILVIGKPIAQIIFFRTGEIEGGDYHTNGNYQHSDDLDSLENEWSPTSMLPKLYQS